MTAAEITAIRVDTMRRLADYIDEMRRIGGSPSLDNALFHAAGFMRDRVRDIEAGHSFTAFDDPEPITTPAVPEKETTS